jgi:hypothetical protein
MAAGVDEAAHLALGAGGQAQKGLAQLNPMFPRKPVEPFDPAQEQVTVGGMGHGLGLHAGVDRDPLQARGRQSLAAGRSRDGLGQQLFEPIRPDPGAPAGQRRAVERQDMAEEDLATEGLHVGVLNPLGTDLLIREALHVLEEVQAHHEAGRQSRSTDLGVAGAERRVEAGPIDQACELHQRMPGVDEGVEPRPGQIITLGRQGLRAHRLSPRPG